MKKSFLVIGIFSLFFAVLVSCASNSQESPMDKPVQAPKNEEISQEEVSAQKQERIGQLLGQKQAYEIMLQDLNKVKQRITLMMSVTNLVTTKWDILKKEMEYVESQIKDLQENKLKQVNDSLAQLNVKEIQPPKEEKQLAKTIDLWGYNSKKYTIPVRWVTVTKYMITGLSLDWNNFKVYDDKDCFFTDEWPEGIQPKDIQFVENTETKQYVLGEWLQLATAYLFFIKENKELELKLWKGQYFAVIRVQWEIVNQKLIEDFNLSWGEYKQYEGKQVILFQLPENWQAKEISTVENMREKANLLFVSAHQSDNFALIILQ